MTSVSDVGRAVEPPGEAPPRTQIVLATVGTDVHPFDRLVAWMDTWAAQHPGLRVMVQYGNSRRPRLAGGVNYLDHDALMDWIDQATVVITHGGPATIMEVRSRHGRPIVVPRDPGRGEHVDRHQLDFCRLLARRSLIDLAESEAHLDDLINAQLAAPPLPVTQRGVLPEGVRRFAEVVDSLLDPRPAKAGR